MNIAAGIEPVLSARGLSKAFAGKPAVRSVDLTVRRGDIVGFLGPNGAGKTTVMSMAAGLVNPDAGRIELLGYKNGSSRRDVRARLGFLQEKPRIYPEMTARAYLEFFADLYGVDGSARRVGELLELVGLTDAADREMGKYSRGMQQRACLARVLLHDPEFLMLDEPTLGLDPAGVAEMREIFRSLNARDVTLLFSSHQLAEMERVCDRIILMNGGQVVAAGRQEELISEAQRKRMISVETAEDARDWLDGINEKPGVRSAMIDGDGRVVLTLDDFVGISETDRRAQASRIVTDCGLTVLNVTAGMPSLEELFLQLTARDDTAGNLGG